MAFALEGERSQMNDGKKELAERDRARRARLEKLKPEKPAHKQVEEPSLSSKEQWETTFDAISDWVALIDLKGKVLHTNRAGEDFIGKSSTMIIGQSCCRLVHDSDKHIPGCPLIKMCRSRNRETVELQVPGTNRWVMVTVDPVTNAEGKIIGAVHITRDITNRKKAEEALRRSEEYYRMLTETMNDGLQQIDETGRYVYVNNKMGEILGYSPDEMIGSYWTDFFDENAQKIINKQLTRRKKGVAEPYEIENTRRDEQKIFIRISPQPIFDEKGEFRGSFAVVTDITERKKAEEALKDSEARLSVVLKKVPAVLLLVDSDRRVHLVNEAATRFAKRTADEMTGLRGGDTLRCLHSLDDPKGCGYGPFCEICVVRNTVLETFKAGKGFLQKEAQLPFDIDGKTVELSLLVSTATLKVSERQMVLVCLENITERKKAEEALRESEEHYRMLAETMNDGLQQIDETGRYVYVNNKMGEILGYSPDEMIGGYWTDFFDENAQKIINKKLTQRKKGVAEPYEIENTRRNGQKIFIRISPQPIFDEKGEFRGSFAVVTDITERKEAAQKLQEYQAQLKSLASQMPAVEEHAKQKIAAGLHDNIGQKLAMAKFELQSLMKSISDNTILDSINDICGEITNVIEDVHSLIFEIRNPLLDEIGLTVALEKYITEEIQVKSGIKCELNDKTGDLKLEQNVRSVLYRATRELLMNAVKHSQAHNIKVHIYIHTNNLYIRVEDDGVGFEVGEIILLPTKTGGFGLFSIKEQLEYLEANLQVESRVGHGTKAIITWPLKLKQADQV